MHRSFLIIASVLGALSVVLGAFGSHGLRKIVPPETVNTFETGVRYQFYHTFALFVVAVLFEKFSNGLILWSGYSFIIGIVLFSGSLYLLTLLKATETVGVSKIGIVTPIGGLFFVLGWCLLLAGVWKKY